MICTHVQVEEVIPDERDVSILLRSVKKVRGVLITPELSFRIWTEVKRGYSLGGVNWTGVGRTVLKVEKAGTEVQRLWNVSVLPDHHFW